MRSRLAVIAAAATALTAFAALGLQLVLMIERMSAEGAGLAAVLWRFVGFFTILANAGVAVVATAMAAAPAGRLAGPRVRLAAAASIVFVGLVYSLLLRSAWSPTGLQAVADHALHDATPLLFLAAWLLADHGALKWRDALWAAVPPLLYCVYALIRGAADGWYAYWFLDPNRLTPTQMVLSIALLALALFIVALALVGADRWLARRAARRAP